MRTSLTTVMLIFTLGLASRPIHGETRAEVTLALNEIRMIDHQNGWAMTNVSYVSVCGRESCLLRTADGGAHWRDITPLGGSGHKTRGWRFTALSSLIAWVTSAPTRDLKDSLAIFRTIDGGRTWNSVVMPTARSISFINPREGWLLTEGDWVFSHGRDQAIFHSTDGGEKWTSVSRFYSNNSFRDWIAFLNPMTGWMTEQSLDDHRLLLFVTHDGGRTWQPQEIPLPGVLMPPYSGIFAQPPKFFTATDGILPVYYSVRHDTGQETMIVAFYATHDSGTTWTPTTPVAPSKPLLTYAVADMNHAWVTAGGVLQATSDGGRHWAQLPRNPLFAIPADNKNPYTQEPVGQLDFISPEVGWAVRSARDYPALPTPPFLLKTLDGGLTWSPVTYTISSD